MNYKQSEIMHIRYLVASIVMLLAGTATAYDAQINFSGNFIDSTCKVNASATPASMTVELAPAKARAFQLAGDVLGNKDFTIALSDCTATTTTVKWDNMANVDSGTGALMNTASGGSNVQVRVLSGSTPIDMRNDAGRSFDGDSETLIYTAQYYAKTVPVTPGIVSTFGTVSLSYK